MHTRGLERRWWRGRLGGEKKERGRGKGGGTTADKSSQPKALASRLELDGRSGRELIFRSQREETRVDGTASASRRLPRARSAGGQIPDLQGPAKVVPAASRACSRASRPRFRQGRGRPMGARRGRIGRIASPPARRCWPTGDGGPTAGGSPRWPSSTLVGHWTRPTARAQSACRTLAACHSRHRQTAAPRQSLPGSLRPPRAPPRGIPLSHPAFSAIHSHFLVRSSASPELPCMPLPSSPLLPPTVYDSVLHPPRLLIVEYPLQWFGGSLHGRRGLRRPHKTFRSNPLIYAVFTPVAIL